MTSQAAGLNALGSSPRWNLLSDRIERSLEDVLSDVPSLVPPRAQTAPPPQGTLLEDLFDAGNDVRLDYAYPEFYREHQGVNAQLPSPLDTTTLFSNIARQWLDEKARSSSRQDMGAGQNVQQLFHALQGLQEARSKAQTPVAPHDVQNSLADGLAQMRIANLEAAASLSRNGTPPPNLAQYTASPGPYRSQLSPAPHSGRQSPMPQTDPRLYGQDIHDVHASDAPTPASFLQGSSQVPPYPSSFPPSNQMPDINPRLRADLHGGPTLPAHPNMSQLGYHNSCPRPTPPGAPPLPGPPPAPSSFQSTFNAAYYAACLAQQSSGAAPQGPPGPPVVMDAAGHIVPVRDVPYGMRTNDPPLPPEVALPDRQHGFVMPPAPGAIPSSLHPPYMEPRPAGAGGMPGRGPGRHQYPGMGMGPGGPPPHMDELAPQGGRGGGRGGGGGLARDRGKPPRRDAGRRDRPVFDAGAQMDLTLPELSGRIFDMAKEQHGCRYLQRLLGAAPPPEVQLLLDEVLPHIGTLMVDPFGNYLVQKVLDVCTPPQRLAVLERACAAPGGLPEITRNTHGTRAAQKLVESIETPEEASMFIAQLRPQCLRLILDGNSNHVVQRCLQKFDAAHTVDIMDTVAAHCHDVARHRHGCCVLQRCMDYAAPERKRDLVLRVSQHGLDLSQNAFGNYVVQYILDTGMVDACDSILQQLQGRFAYLSCQKFASNVVEKALKLTTVGMEHWRAIIVQELIDAPDHADLLKDQFGNYVLQSALRVTSGDLHGRLVAAIKPHMACLKSLQHGKRILQQLQGAV